jgi:hypothetical protein
MRFLFPSLFALLFTHTHTHTQIYEYSQQMDDSVEKEISSDVTLKIIDMILVNETSLNKAMVSREQSGKRGRGWGNKPLIFHLIDGNACDNKLFFLFFFLSLSFFVCVCLLIPTANVSPARANTLTQQVKKLQELVQLVTINRESTSFVLPVSSSVVANPKPVSSSAASISPMRQLRSLQIFKTNVKALPFSYQIYG